MFLVSPQSGRDFLEDWRFAPSGSPGPRALVPRHKMSLAAARSVWPQKHAFGKFLSTLDEATGHFCLFFSLVFDSAKE